MKGPCLPGRRLSGSESVSVSVSAFDISVFDSDPDSDPEACPVSFLFSEQSSKFLHSLPKMWGYWASLASQSSLAEKRPKGIASPVEDRRGRNRNRCRLLGIDIFDFDSDTDPEVWRFLPLFSKQSPKMSHSLPKMWGYWAILTSQSSLSEKRITVYPRSSMVSVWAWSRARHAGNSW